jgi:uncharacterized protein
MKYLVRTVCMGLYLMAGVATAQTELPGNWEGILNPPNASLRIELQITDTSEGLRAVMISHDQGGAEIAADSVIVEEQRVTFNFQSISGSYVTNISGNQMEGTWSQGGLNMPLTMKKKSP